MDRMRRTLLLLALAPMGLSAQESDWAFVHHTPRSQYLFPQEASPVYVLRGASALRSAPATDAPHIASLQPGQAVIVEEIGPDTLVVDGVRSNWCHVSVGDRSGWTWGGNLTRHAFGGTADPTVKFFAGLDHVVPPDTSRIDVSFRIVAVKDGKEIDRIVVRSPAWGFEAVRNAGNLGLRNVDDVILLDVPCIGGCGCTTGMVVVFWSGGRFHHVADLLGSPDGDYSTNEHFIFPAEVEGLPGMIIRETSNYLDTDEEQQEEAEDEGASITRTLVREYLRWDGKALIPSGKATERMSYRQPVGP